MKIHHQIGRDRKESPKDVKVDNKAVEKAMNRLTLVGITVIVSTAAVKISDNLSKK